MTLVVVGARCISETADLLGKIYRFMGENALLMLEVRGEWPELVV